MRYIAGTMDYGLLLASKRTRMEDMVACVDTDLAIVRRSPIHRTVHLRKGNFLDSQLIMGSRQQVLMELHHNYQFIEKSLQRYNSGKLTGDEAEVYRSS